MLMAHKFIDCLMQPEGHSSRYEVVGPYAPVAARLALADRIRRAIKFDFGDLVLELNDATPTINVAGEAFKAYKTPVLTTVEKQFWVDGLIPLPFEEVWFEFVVDGWRSALLIKETSQAWLVQRHDYVPDAGREMFTWTQTVVKVLRQPLHEGKHFVAEYDQQGPAFLSPHDPAYRTWMDQEASAAGLGIYLALMLNSKTTEKEHSLPPVALNQKRVRTGKEPLHAHHLVTIVPRRFTGGSHGGASALDGRKKLHWRRSHPRCYDRPTAMAKWAPEYEHNGIKGWYVAVIPRHLVGKAELGELSHEYKVRSSRGA